MPTGEADDLTGESETTVDVLAATSPPRSPADGISFASLRRRLLRGSACVFLGRVVTIGLGLVINVLLARLLTHAEPESCCPLHTRYGNALSVDT